MVNKSKRPAVVFKHPATGHETSTSLPAEQNRLKAQGYVEKVAKPAPAAKPADPKK